MTVVTERSRWRGRSDGTHDRQRAGGQQQPRPQPAYKYDAIRCPSSGPVWVRNCCLRSTGRALEPLRSQLELQLREAIRSGRLAAGERLPSSRALATELGLSRGLVLECYAQLQAEGFLTSRSGSATRVAAGALTPSDLPAVPSRSGATRRRLPARRPGPDQLSAARLGVGDARERRDATPAELGYGDSAWERSRCVSCSRDTCVACGERRPTRSRSSSASGSRRASTSCSAHWRGRCPAGGDRGPG